VIHMSGSKNLRVVVFCLDFETVRFLKPIKHYRADKVIMLYKAKRKAYREFKKEIERQMDKGVKYEAIETTIWDFGPCLKELLVILKNEKKEGNHVYVNLTGTPAYSAAAMVACMMFDGTPFFAPVKEFTNDSSIFFLNARPVGVSSDVKDPLELPTFHLEAPNVDVIRGLHVWKERKEKGLLTTDTKVIEDFEKEGLMEKVHDNRGRVTQKAKMQYRRRFLEKWLSEKWVEPKERGKYELTDYGKVVVEVF